MKKLLSLRACCVVFLLIIASCNTDKAIDMSKYEDVDAGSMQLFAPDPSLKNKPVRIPTPTKISSWPSSGDILSDIPQDILVKSLSPVWRSYNVHGKFGRDYHFVGNNPVISGNKLFVLGNSSALQAYKLSNLKELLWKKDLGNTEEDVFRGGGMFVSNNSLAVTNGSNSIVLLDANKGTSRWQYVMSNISRAAPVIYKGMVFALTVDNKLYCLDLATGMLKWVNEGAAEQLGVIKASSIIAYENMVIVPYSVGQVYAINTEDGKQLWNLSLDEKFSAIGDLFTPIINNGVAYISSLNGTLYALDLKTGAVTWSNHYAGGNEIWLAGDYIFAVNKNYQTAAINKLSGTVKWIQDLNESVNTGPILINKELFVVSSSGSLIVLSPLTGNETRRIQIERTRYASPIATSDGLFLLSEKGELLVF